MKDLLSGRDILCHLQKLITGIFAFSPSVSLSSVTSRATALILKTQDVWFHKKTMRSLPFSRWKMGLSVTSPLTSCLPLDPATSSFQQRIKQLLTEEWRDWQVKVSFLVRRASLCLSVFPELTFHIPAWLEQLLNFSAVKYEFLEPRFSHRLPKMTSVHRQRGGWGIKFLNKLAFECYVKFLLYVPWMGSLSRCLYVQRSSVQQHLQSAADARLTWGNFQPQWNMWEYVVTVYSF